MIYLWLVVLNSVQMAMGLLSSDTPIMKLTVQQLKIAMVVLTTLILILAINVHGQMGGDFEVSKNTIDGGGGISAGGDFTLTATIGQPDASVQVATGGSFVISGGFWARGSVNLIYKNGFES